MTKPCVIIYQGLSKDATSTTGGYPGRDYVCFYPRVWQEISFSRSAQGGDDNATLIATIPATQIDAWIALLGSYVDLYTASGNGLWHGTIWTIEIAYGGVRQTVSYDGMVNACRVRYTLAGVQTLTSEATDSTSITLYGRFMALIDVGDTTTALAEQQRDAVIAQRAAPSRTEEVDLQSGLTRKGDAVITLSCVGMYHHLSRVYYTIIPGGSSSVWGGVLVSTLIGAALGNDPATTGGTPVYLVPSVTPATLFYQDSTSGAGATIPTGTVDGGAFSTTYATNGYENARDHIDRLVAVGDNDIPLVFMLQRNFYWYSNTAQWNTFAITRQWAGNTPTTITYYLRPPDRLLTSYGAPIPFELAEPDAMAQIITGPERNYPGADTATRIYIRRTTYTWRRTGGESLAIEPQSQFGSAAALRLFR